MNLRIGIEARGLEARLDHPEPAEGEDRPLEGLVRLQTHDHFVRAIDIAGLVCEQRRGILRIDGKHSLLPLVREVGLQFRPNGLCALRWSCQKVLVSRVRCDVPDDEIANIDGRGPVPGPKGVPAIAGIGMLP